MTTTSGTLDTVPSIPGCESEPKIYLQAKNCFQKLSEGTLGRLSNYNLTINQIQSQTLRSRFRMIHA
jgi:hypothetical protein